MMSKRTSKRIALALIALALIIAVLMISYIGRFDHRYERTECYARRESLTTVVAHDIVSNTLWVYEVTPDDPFEQGWVSLRMDDNGTDDITDDIITDVRVR